MNDHPVADDTLHTPVENAAGPEMKDEFLVLPANGMAGIGASLVPGHNINVLCDEVDNLAFPLVAPLASDDNRYWHVGMELMTAEVRMVGLMMSGARCGVTVR